MGQKLFGSLNPVHTGGPMQVSIAFAEQHTSGYPWKMNGTVRQEVFSLRGGLWFGTYHLLNYPASTACRCTALPTSTPAGMPAVTPPSRTRW